MAETTRHTITATLRFNVSSGGCEDRLSLKADLTYSVGRTASGPDFTLIEARIVENGDGLDPTDEQLRDRAQDWLDDEGYDAACQRAEGVEV